MTVRREPTATGSAANCLHMESERLLYGDGHFAICRTGTRKTRGIRRVGRCGAARLDAGSHMRQVVRASVRNCAWTSADTECLRGQHFKLVR